MQNRENQQIISFAKLLYERSNLPHAIGQNLSKYKFSLKGDQELILFLFVLLFAASNFRFSSILVFNICLFMAIVFSGKHTCKHVPVPLLW